MEVRTKMESTTLQKEFTDQEGEELFSRMESDEQFDLSHDTEPQLILPKGSGEVQYDEYGFPFEEEGIYNSAPLEFEEVTRALWVVTSSTHYAAVRYNRLSPLYFTLMGYLEKDIKQLGSSCITKAVLEQSGEKFENLDGIELKELFSMVSVHFRKCCMAYNDLQKSAQGMDMNLVSWIFRWAVLADRLRVTQEKIDKIRSGKFKIDTLLDRANVYKGEPRMQRENSARMVSPRMRNSSLPIMKSFAREIKKQKETADKQERAMHREAERAARRLEKSGIITPGTYKPSVYHARTEPKLPDIGMNTNELRRLLMDEAKSRGDMAEAGMIAAESPEKLIERFQKFQRAAKSSAPPVRGPRSGPSDETRRKLREKRKKRK